MFFGATFALTWACQAPGIMAMRSGETPAGLLMLLIAIGSAGPTLVAIGLSAVHDGRGGVRALLRPASSAPWLLMLVALLFPAAAHLIGSAALWIAGAYRAAHIVYLPLRPEQIAIAIVAPLGEEYGWRGYALPRLQTIMTPVRASLLIGLVWALWHVPTLFVPEARGTTSLELGLYLVAYLSSSVIYTWLYNAGRGSMRGPLLAHLGIHLDNVFRASALGDGLAPLFSTTVVLTLVAIALIATGRLHARTAVRAAAVG